MPRCRMTDTDGSSLATKCVFHRPSFFVRIPGLCASNGVVERSLILCSALRMPLSPSACGEEMNRAGESAKRVEYRVRAKINKGGLGPTFANCSYCSAISR